MCMYLTYAMIKSFASGPVKLIWRAFLVELAGYIGARYAILCNARSQIGAVI